MKKKKSNYFPYAAFEAEGGRIGVMTCKRCGAAVILSNTPAEKSAEIHDEWHKKTK